MILDDFYLLPAWFCYVIINIWNLERYMHTTNRCVPRKIANGAEYSVCVCVCVCVCVYVCMYMCVHIYVAVVKLT
jgi:hypothetical protein